jgi:hypothetical protein
MVDAACATNDRSAVAESATALVIGELRLENSA